MKTCHFSNLEEAKRVWQPRYSYPLTQADLLEICFNCKNLLNFVVQVHQKRLLEGDFKDE
jgi:hypothetical protein